MLRLLFFFFATLVTGWLIWTNVAIHSAPRVGSEEELNDLHAQLRFLEERVHAGLGNEMQRLFPEGSVFTHALYGAAWCGYAQRTHSVSGLDSARSHALREARWALSLIEQPDVQARFPALAEPKFGVFYCGWRNYLLASIMVMDTLDQGGMELLDRNSDALDSAFTRNSSPFMESYPGMAWPADNAVAMASLALHNRVRLNAHQAVIERWSNQVRERFDERGMIPHAWNTASDRQQEHARGCSQALMNAFLPLIDSALARDQFQLFRENFFMERFGVPLVREYPKGLSGWGDVDSGPVILGAGCAASVVGTAACRMNGDGFHAQEFDATTEGFGLVQCGDHKRYLLGMLPIADLFIAWGRSMQVQEPHEPELGFKRFHFCSALALIVLWSPWWGSEIRRRYRTRQVQ